MSNSRDQPSPISAERCSQGCGRGCGGTAAGPAGKEEERELSCVSPNSLKSAPKAQERVAVELGSLCPGPRRGGLSQPHSFPAPLSPSAQGRAPPCALGSPRAPGPARTAWTGPLARPKA